jgi:hypothetical protein
MYLSIDSKWIWNQFISISCKRLLCILSNEYRKTHSGHFSSEGEVEGVILFTVRVGIRKKPPGISCTYHVHIAFSVVFGIQIQNCGL